MAHTKTRKLIENEAKFRQLNESLQKGFDQLQQTATEHGSTQDVSPPEDEIYFLCECSDENCKERVLMTLERYTEIHKDRKQFVIVPGHEVPAVETLLEREDGFDIVEKLIMPPESVHHLHKTDVENV